MPGFRTAAGHEEICFSRSPYMDSSCALSLVPSKDIFYPPFKRLRVTAPFNLITEEEKEAATILKKHQLTCSIDDLPDECLFEILKRLPRSQDRSIASCISKRWLMLLSSIQTSETVEILRSSRKHLPDLNEPISSELESDSDVEITGFLSRCLEADEATDTRLAAIAISTSGRGGLGKLKICAGHSTCKVTNVGLSAIGKLCPSLRVLSLWKVPFVSDSALAAIADGCPMLESLDLCQCPLVTDKGLIAIAQKCPNLCSLFLDSCSSISNGGLQAIGRHCQKLNSASIKDCPLVGDKGISGLVASASSLKKIKLQSLNINDVSLAVIGHYGKAVTGLSLIALENISERGFWTMGNARNMINLTSCTISSCPGITDLGLEAISTCCLRLKHFSVQKSGKITDTGLKVFARSATMLESLHLENCTRITFNGIINMFLSCKMKFLRSLALIKCLGIRDIMYHMNELPIYSSLRSLVIRDCPGFTDSSLALVCKLFPNLQQIDLSGLVGLTDIGFLSMLRNSKSQLVKMSLRGCINISDASIYALAKMHGKSLKLVSLDGCKRITDKSLLAIATNCTCLLDLNVSRCAVTDIGVAALSSAEQLNLRVLSLAGCYGVTKRTLQLLGNMKGSLEGLNVQHCKVFNPDGIGLLEEKLWWCDILS